MDDGAAQKEGKPLTNFEAYTILAKSVLGFGTLLLPLTIVSVGILCGVFLIILFTIVLVYGVYLMASCMAETRNRKGAEASTTMSQAITIAFSEGPSCCASLSKVAGVFADIILILTHYCLNVVYIIFITECFFAVVHNQQDTLHLRLALAITGLCTLPIFLMRNFGWLYTICLISNIIIYISFVIILLEIGIEGAKGDITLAQLDFRIVPMFIGLIMFSISSVGVMTIVEPKMEQSKKFFGFKGTLSMSSILVFITNLLTAVIGYCLLGDEMVVRFLENLGPCEPGADAAKIGMAAAVYFSIPLNGYVPIDIILKRCLSKDMEPSSLIKIDYVLRTVFVLLSTLNAACAPVMMPIAKVFGSFYLSFLNLIFPACMELCLLYNEANGKSKLMLFKDIMLIFMGILVFACGLYSAVIDIMIEYAGMKFKPMKWDALKGFRD